MRRRVFGPSAVLASAVTALMLAVMSLGARGQTGIRNGEWPSWGADLANTRYAPFDQITPENFSRLTVAWHFKTDNLGPRPEYNFESTPIMVKGVLYSTAGTRRSVVALNAATGELLWVHQEDEGARGAAAPRQLSGRGLSYWTDGREERILYVTPGYRLIALNAKTGMPVESFGQKGVVDLKQEDDQQIDLVTGEVGLHATPLVVRDVVVVGAAHLPGGAPRSRAHVKGYVRAFDVRTGKRLWIFHTIPQPGEFGNDTWLKDSWSYTGNAGSWTQMAADEELGLVYLPIELPTGDYYGGHRPGNGLFGETLVAVDIKTGQRKWHYQLVHHGLWDMDISAPPILADITVNGRQIKAIAQPTKQSFLYVFDRATGQPVWPIVEKPVPQGDVPGEWYSPTQPFPTRPPAFDRQGTSNDDWIDFTPELHEEAIKLASRYKMGPLFTPPVVSRVEGPLATLILPNNDGGANWMGGSFDPETKMLYVFSNTVPAAIGLVKDPNRSDMDYIQGNAAAQGRGRAGGGGAAAPGGGRAGGDGGRGGAAEGPQAGEGGRGGGLTVQGLPLVKPPWGRITAIDLNKGDIAWQIAHGETPDYVKNHPALKGLTIPRTGRQGRAGTVVTKTLVFAGEGGFFTTPTGARGAMLRAYDKATGREVGAVYMPAPASGSPMTYMVGGKQYIVVPASGAGYTAELLAFTLP
jgi:quinoprotein glucose dehydrogenase